MRVYSTTTQSFVAKCEEMARHILAQEMGLTLGPRRVHLEGITYPLNIVVFVDKTRLGYFSSPYFEIGLNQKLIYLAKDSIIKDILRHELLHYYLFIIARDEEHDHGETYKMMGNHFGFSPNILKASFDLDRAMEKREGEIPQEKILHKVKALMALAQSSNQHESEMAALRANELILKHNLAFFNAEKENEIFVANVLSQRKKDAKLSAINLILKHFLVHPILSYGHKTVRLEVTGTRENVELAEYMAHYLASTLENEWQNIKKQNHLLKSVTDRNSFFIGVARGFEEKMQNQQKNFHPIEKKSLAIIGQHIDQFLPLVYPKLSHTKSYGTNNFSQEAFSFGRKTGQNLNINHGLKNSQSNQKLLEY